MNRFQIWGDNTGTTHGFKSYVNGYMDTLAEAKTAFNRAKKEWQSYHYLELHQLDFKGRIIKKITTFKRNK